MLKRSLFTRLMNSVGDDGSDTGGGSAEAVGSSNDERVAMLERTTAQPTSANNTGKKTK